MNNLENLCKKREQLAQIMSKSGVKDAFLLQAVHDLLFTTIKESKVHNERIEKIIESLSTIAISLSADKDIIEQAKKILALHASGEFKISNPGDFPVAEKVEITNLHEIKIHKPPEEISIKRPAWYKELDMSFLSKDILALGNAIVSAFKKLAQDIVIKNKKPEDAIPVRLVTPDGKGFYKAEGGKGGGSTFIQDNALSYGKSPSAITPISVDDTKAWEYELPSIKKFLYVQNAGSGIVAFGDSSVAYGTYPTLTPRQGFEFINCPAGFKVYFKCDTGKTATIVGFTR